MLKDINEWTQVYTNGGIPYENVDGRDNLKMMVDQFNNGHRSPNQVYSILRGMGVPRDRSIYAVENYWGKKSENPLYYYDANNKNKLNKMDNAFNIPTLSLKLKTLKESLEKIAGDETRVNYSAQTAVKIVEKYIIKLNDLQSSLRDIDKTENLNLKAKLTERLNIADIKSNPEFYYGSMLLQELATHNQLINVSEFIGEMRDIFENNKFKAALSNALYALNNKDSKYYSSVINDLEFLIKKDEKEITEGLNYILEKHSWVPLIKVILNAYSNDKKVTISNEEGKVSKVYSPVEVNEKNKSITFALGNKFYTLSNDSIEETTQISPTLYNINKSFQSFKILDNSFILFEDKNSLEISITDGTVKINGKNVDHKNGESFRNHLIRSRFFHLDEMYKIDQLMYLVEQFDTIIELDFITSISSKINEGVMVNLIKLDNTLYVNRINPSMKKNELIKAESAEDAKLLVKEMVNFDISKSIHEQLNEENKIRTKLEIEKSDLIDKINFLQEKKSELEKTTKLAVNREPLFEAIKLLDEELKDKEIKLQHVYQQLGNVSEAKSLEDQGYVEATLLKPELGFKVGDTVYVYAVDYTTSGDTDKVKVIESQGKPVKMLVKKNLKIA